MRFVKQVPVTEQFAFRVPVCQSLHYSIEIPVAVSRFQYHGPRYPEAGSDKVVRNSSEVTTVAGFISDQSYSVYLN